MTVSEKILEKLVNEQILVDVFSDYFDLSMFGFIRKFNRDLIVFEHYNDDAIYNGIIIFRRQDITRLRWDNNEINSMASLIKREDTSVEKINIDTIVDTIKSVNKIYGYVSLQIQDINPDWTIIGEVQFIDDDTLVLHEYGTPSSLDRAMLMLSIQEITRIDVDGTYENNLMKIHSRNNKR